MKVRISFNQNNIYSIFCIHHTLGNCLLWCLILFNSFVFAQRAWVFDEELNNVAASGYIGQWDGKSLKVITNYDKNPFQGKKCIKIQTNGSETWSGLFFQAAGRWRKQAEKDFDFPNLAKFNYFEFYAKADFNTTINVGFGEGDEDSDSFQQNNILLTKDWKRYCFYVGDVDKSSLNTLFSIVINKKATVYLDNINFYLGNKKQPYSENEQIVSKPYHAEPVPVKVTLGMDNEKHLMFVGGNPFFVRGAGGHGHLKQVKNYGGNSIRTWSHENAGEILDSAHHYGLKVMFGLWVQHERHGFDYDDAEAVEYQLKFFKEIVEKYKNHPALLLWGVGNEVDLFYKNTKVWYAVQDIAKMIHEIDPNHPTCTVTAGFDPKECELILERCPDIDIYGVNTYGDIDSVSFKIKKAGWKKPYLITEWGPTGHWEVPKTFTGAPIEQTSTEKAQSYLERYKVIENDSNQCIGSYAFLWGYKQETTPTWYGIFLENGEETAVMDEIHYNWSKKYPENRAPIIHNLSIGGKKSTENIVVKKGKTFIAKALVEDPEKEMLNFRWRLFPESTTTKAGGDWEEKPEEISQFIKSVSEDGSVEVQAPLVQGTYRLFVFAKDPNSKTATANVIFVVE